MILHTCPHCGFVRDHIDYLAGRLISCERCRESFRLPPLPPSFDVLVQQQPALPKVLDTPPEK